MKKILDEMILRNELEQKAEKLLEEGYTRYRKNGGNDTFTYWKERLLVQYVTKSIMAEQSKGAGI